MDKDTKQRIIEAAQILFWEKGYHATGVAEIQKRAEVHSGSFYHFFKSKEELLEAVLEFYLQLLYPVVMAPSFEKYDDPIERIFGVLAGYRTQLIETNFTLGCPIGKLASEVEKEQVRARQLINANFEGWKKHIADCFEEANIRIGVAHNSMNLANLTLTVMEGSLLQVLAEQSIAPFDNAMIPFREYIEMLYKP
ncbi:TetR/AcrR family transcriptional regulator [bacterium]|nr:TetR/AcrR family transcriptional regulator [bacterium]